MWILAFKRSTDRPARWRFCLMEFKFEVRYRLGRKHMEADALSLFPTSQTDDSNFDDGLPAYAAVDH